MKLVFFFLHGAGVAFDTTQPVNYAVSNIISAIVYGSRFEYDDPKFKAMVKRANENIQLTGSPSVQVFLISSTMILPSQILIFVCFLQ